MPRYIDYTESDKVEKLDWDGAGFYATKEVGSHENAHYTTVMMGTFEDGYVLCSKRAHRNGWGGVFELKEPYGEKQ